MFALGCLNVLQCPRRFPFHEELIHLEYQKHPFEKHCYIKWALEGCPENLNKNFNVVALAETAASSAHFQAIADKCCLNYTLQPLYPVFFILTLYYENFQTYIKGRKQYKVTAWPQQVLPILFYHLYHHHPFLLQLLEFFNVNLRHPILSTISAVVTL